MDIDGLLRDPLSRRRLLRVSGAGAAGGTAALLAACGGDATAPPATGPDESDQADVEVLNGVLDLELMTVEAYKAAAARLRGAALQTAQAFLEQEQDHADGLAEAIKEAGGTPNRPKSSYAFPRLRSQAAALRFAVEFENRAIAAYIDALPKLSKRDLRSTASAIVTTEAEHVAVLLQALGEDPVPSAFVTGAPA